mmetsp:Transcript_9974/g.12964  ORF Transcript_9974/g.12964 Transcript_9974/m.12964 type:complete len:256 (-) Transcript_9974:46-813(-)
MECILIVKEFLYGMKDSPIVSDRIGSVQSLSRQMIANSGITPELIDSFDMDISFEEKSLELFGLSEVANYGSLPTLQYAIQHQSTLSTVQMLVNAKPECKVMRDECGNLPLHIALMSKASPDLISFLSWDSPKSITMKNSRGQNAFHIAAECDSVEDVFRCLVRADVSRQALHARDSQGYTPVHIAILRGLHANKIRAMIKDNPEAILVRDSLDRTPFKLAIKNRSRSNVLEVLLEGFTIAQCQDRKRVRFVADI